MKNIFNFLLETPCQHHYCANIIKIQQKI
uniref:Uncharacterized protein n=1 Tax=Rhizophora mucronata TaxID=61149 RepID=A0A2P2IU75_RHIMU